MSNYSESVFDESNHNTSWYKVFNLVREKTKVLDVGCSSGNFGKALIDKKQCHVDGIEIDKLDAKEASGKLDRVWILNVERDDLKQLPRNYYDYVYFGDVIEHLADPINTLKRIKPLLAKTGRVVFSIPNMGHVGVRLALLKGQFEYTETGLTDKTHLHFYTQDEVYRVFEEAGYSIENLDFVQKDYPKELLAKELKLLGLKADAGFYKKMSQPSASAFQFVGTAKPSKAVKHKLKRFGPLDLFEKFYTDTKKNYELRIQALEKELARTKQELNHKVAHPYRSVAAHLKRKLN
jgi:2-polyprenyl-3-methyl-5-hydroxy-6-metoxy-1,4-benzoquinol methylase